MHQTLLILNIGKFQNLVRLWMIFVEFRSKCTKFWGNSWISSQALQAFSPGFPMSSMECVWIFSGIAHSWWPWLKYHLLFPLFFISHIYLMNDSNTSHMNDNNISHQRFTVVVLCSKSAHSVHWLFVVYFFHNLNEYMIWRNHHCWENQVTWHSVEWLDIVLSPFYTFSEQQPKAIEEKVCKYQSWSYVQSSERYKICSVPSIFKTARKLYLCAKGKHKTKRNISPCQAQNKAAEAIFWILESKNLSVASTGNSSFRWHRQCQVLTYILHFIEIINFILNL